MEAPPIQYARTADGVNLAYCTLADGPPALLLHPIPVSHLRLEWRVPAFGEVYDLITRDMRLIRYDPRATGLSGPAEDLALDAFVRDIHTVLTATTSDPAAIIAPVGATPLAMAFAATHPEQVSCLVLLAPELDHDRRLGIQRALQEHAPAHAEERMARLLNPYNKAEHEEAIGAGATENLRTWERLGVRKQMRDVQRHRVDALLAQITCPTLVVHYPDHAFSDGINVAGRIADARLVLREGSNAPLLNPDLPELFDLVRDFALEHAAARATSGKPPAACGLSDRELQVLCHVAAGSKNREIAESLSLSRHTVARHVSSILKKTELANRVVLATYATRHGLRIEDE